MTDPSTASFISHIDFSSIGTTIVTAGIAIGSTMFALRRRASRDTVEIVKDRAEESVISHLERQRDRAVEESNKYQNRLMVSEADRNDAINKVTTLTREMEHLTGQIKILKDLVERLGTNLDETRRELQSYMSENAALSAKLEVLESRVTGHGGTS